MDQSRFNQLKSLRENIVWKVEEQRLAFLRRVVALIEDWEDDLPNLRHIFQPAEIELLLVDAVNYFSYDRNGHPGRTFVDFVARSGYVDEPAKVKGRSGVRPSLRRTTPLHHLFELHWNLKREHWFHGLGGLDWLCFKLLKIYDRYDVNYVDAKTGVTHFHVACCCLLASDDDQLRIIRRFLELGQNPNRVVRETGYSPLHLALQRNNGEAALLLLRAGARPNVATKYGDTPLHIMSQKGDPGAAVAETFFRACDESNRLVRIEARNRDGNRPLAEALLHQNVQMAALLLRRGANPNSVNGFGNTPLHICARGHIAGVRRRLKIESAVTLFKICDELNLALRVNARNDEDKTPLEVAIANLLSDTVDVLLDHGADLYKGLFSTVIDPKMICHSLAISVMKAASGFLIVAERLEAKGYDFSRNDALTIMKCFAELGLFEKFTVVKKKKFYDDEKFTSQAKKIIVNSSLSLYELIHLRSEEEEKLLTYQDYFRFASSLNLWKLSTEFHDACVLHVCEKMSRGFFRRWALDPFHELIHKRLPLECCEMILETLNNQDLYNICLAAAGPSTFGCDDAVEKFLEAGQDPNVIWKKTGDTPLHLAADSTSRNRQYVIELLLRSGADPNLANAKGFTPLHILCLKDDGNDFVEILFKVCDEKQQLVQIDAKDNSGNSPLNLAVDWNKQKTVEALLRRGADPNSANGEGLTPLHYICKDSNDDGMAELFFKVNDETNQLVQVDALDKLGRTPLQYAVAGFLPRVVDLLLDHGADLSKFVFPTESYYGRCFTADYPKLDLASECLTVVERLEKRGYKLDRSGALKIMEFFVQWGLFAKSADLDKSWYDDRKVVRKAKEKMIKSKLSLYKLLQLRPEKAAKQLTFDVNYTDASGLTHFHVACNYGCNDVVKKFLKLGQNPKQLVPETGDSPLHLALAGGRMEVVKLLLKHGANPNLKNKNEKTPFHISWVFCDDDSVEKFFKIIDNIRQTVQIDAKDNSGDTPLHSAVYFNKQKTVEALLRRGADPNSANGEGLTPLHYICKDPNEYGMAELFFKVNDETNQLVQVDALDELGRTPLQYAVAGFSPDTVDVLLDHGADLSRFVFPTESYYGDCFLKSPSLYPKLGLASECLTVVERLEKRGYKLDRSGALKIMEFFVEYELFAESENLDKSWYDDKQVIRKTKEIKIIPSLSLFNVICLSPEEAAKQLTCTDYCKFARRSSGHVQ
ncbi:unnamed protein product [Trichogramma brassicae]|uniref:Uncharacterized protein n=1 Tax=Trichogramma brassicae TaxID=86971 RepID=A0A6H5IUQ4_9HYME|nr:unnamed protein product [Trichogramma brassicae]